MSTYYKTVVLFGLLICMISCELNFDAFEDNEEYIFSIQGVLNPLNDTQSIRVSPVRQSFRQQPDPLDAVVTLTHIESGTTVGMNGILTQFAENAWAWNYTSDMPIEYENTYQVTVTRSDGAVSHATAQIPKAIPDPEITCHCEGAVLSTVDIFLKDVEKPAVAEVSYDWGAPSEFNFERQEFLPPIASLLHQVSVIDNDITPPESGGERIWVSIDDDMYRISVLYDRNRTNLFINSIHVEIVSAGPEWPETDTFSPEELTLATVSGNVENGIGQLAGAVGLGTVVIDHDYPCPDGFPPPPCGWVIEE